MAVSRSKAYEVLGLEEGASHDQIRAAYKKLALEWHPDKHGNSEVATKKFQEISSSYKRLTSKDEEDQIELSFEEMFDLFTHLVFGGRGYIPAHYFYDNSSDSEDQYCLNRIPDQCKKNKTHVYKPSRTNNNLRKDRHWTSDRTFEEARTNGEALIKEEEREKRLREKKRERKRRRKQKKREEKENKTKLSKSSGQHSASDDSSESDSDDEEDLSRKDWTKVSSNNSNGVLQPSSSSEQTMPNKKASSSDKKPNSSLDKKQVGSKKNASENQNGISSKQNKKNTDKKEQRDSSSGEDEATQGLDLNSAFFAGTVNSVNKKLANQKKNKKGGTKSENSEPVENAQIKIQRSRTLAIRGNELATKGDYKAAIELFSQAISLDPNDHRFFGNRSYCFDQSGQFDKALKDAERAINLSKDWAKGYFRKGRALAGLKSFSDAEKAYEQVLQLDPVCDEAVQELKRVRVCQLMDIGFTRLQSEIAVKKYGTVQESAEALLSGTLNENSLHDLEEEVYISDDEDVLSETIQKAKTDIRNPERLRSIWIGNLSQDATEKQVRELFGKFGDIDSMRRLPEKYCAFINYKDSAMASTAMKCLQGYQFFESQLLIKFPDHPITDGHMHTIYLTKKTKPDSDPQPPPPPRQPKPTQHQSNKPTYSQHPGGVSRGPVNGNECYFWRTTGCWYGDRCRYLHLPTSKGMDEQPWHKGAGPV